MDVLSAHRVSFRLIGRAGDERVTTTNSIERESFVAGVEEPVLAQGHPLHGREDSKRIS